MLTGDNLLAVLWRWRLTAVATFAVVLTAAAIVTFQLPKVYATSAYLYVAGGSTAASDFEQVQINQVVTRTFAELLQTRNVANDVAARLPFDMDPRTLQSAVQVAPVEQSQLITITASGSSPRRAQTIANAYAQTFIARSRRIVGSEADVALRLAEPAALVSNQVRPRPRLYLLVAAVLAALAAAAAALLRQRFDQRLALDPSTSEVLDLPVIARIPRAPSGARALVDPDAALDEDGRHLADAYRLALANLTFANQGERPRTLAVVSASRGEGKSTTCVALARAAAELGVKTLLVDGDLRRPQLSVLMHAGPDRDVPGFSTFLLGGRPLSLVDVAIEVPGQDFELVPSGPLPPSPASLLGSPALADFEERARRVYDLVIVDTPPLSVGADASLVAAAVQGTLIVVDAPASRRTALQQAVDQLRHTRATVLGVLVNRGEDLMDGAYYGNDGREGAGGRRRFRRERTPATPTTSFR